MTEAIPPGKRTLDRVAELLRPYGLGVALGRERVSLTLAQRVSARARSDRREDP